MRRLQAPFPVVPASGGQRTAPQTPLETRVAQVVLAVEAISLAMGGLIAALLTLLTLASGREWPLYAAAAAGVSLALLLSAAALGIAVGLLSAKLDKWKVAVIVLEAAVIPLGWWAMSLEAAYQAQNPGDHGPFADGSDAMVSLLGFVFSFGGALVVLSLLGERARLLLTRKATSGRS